MLWKNSVTNLGSNTLMEDKIKNLNEKLNKAVKVQEDIIKKSNFKCKPLLKNIKK